MTGERNYLAEAIATIEEERFRQIHQEGYNACHDHWHLEGQLARAAGAYCVAAGYGVHSDDTSKYAKILWPWENPIKIRTEGDYTENKLKCLTKAGALILAEMERLKRFEENAKKVSKIHDLENKFDSRG